MLLHGGNFGNYCFQDQIKQYSLVAFGCQCLMSNKMKRLSYGCWTRIFEFWCVISMTQKRHGSHATTPRVSNISKAPRSIILVEVVALFHMPVPIATQAEWVTTFPKAFCHVSRRSWPSTSTSTVREPGWWHLLWKCYPRPIALWKFRYGGDIETRLKVDDFAKIVWRISRWWFHFKGFPELTHIFFSEVVPPTLRTWWWLRSSPHHTILHFIPSPTKPINPRLPSSTSLLFQPILQWESDKSIDLLCWCKRAQNHGTKRNLMKLVLYACPEMIQTYSNNGMVSCFHVFLML